jgi:hypothetical protein
LIEGKLEGGLKGIVLHSTETVFSRIAAATTSKQTWTILQTEFQGSSKVIAMKLQILRHEFETLFMKSSESMQDFLSRVMAIICQMRSYGDQITNQTMVAKVLRILTPKFDHVAAAIEESKDMLVFLFDELMDSLQPARILINLIHSHM